MLESILRARKYAKTCAKKILDVRCMHLVGNFVMDAGVDGKVNEKVHSYRIIQCMPACTAGRKMGRPRRIVVHAWTELDLAELVMLRRLNDPKLRPNQLAEVDGEIVARGSGVLSSEDETAEVLAWDEGQNAANFAQALVWDGYFRSVGAADDLTNQLKRANDQILELSRQLSSETIAGQKRLNDLNAEHRTEMSALAADHRAKLTALTLEHNKQLGDLVDEMIKFKMSILKNSGGSGGATVDMDTLMAVALKIADRVTARKD